jgi:hypothetical protein
MPGKLSLRRRKYPWVGGSYHVNLWRGRWRLLQALSALYVQCMGGMDGLELIGHATFY